MKTTPGFAVTGNKGFHITFPNGVCVSVQFGGGNYCKNYDRPIPSVDGESSPDAELAIWDADEKWITRVYDTSLPDPVIPNVTAIEVLKALVWAEAYKGDDET